MAYWNGERWTVDPAEAGPSGMLARQAPRSAWFDWLMTGLMIVALPLAAVVASEHAAGGSGATALQGDVAVTTDGVVTVDSAVATQWAGYEWRGRPPLQIGVRSYLSSPGLVQAASAAAASWSQSAVLDVNFTNGGKRAIEIYEGDYGANQHAAWTQVTKRNGYVSSVMIFINTHRLGGASPWTLQFALCHELGHALGLDHQAGAAEPSCLSPELPGTSPNATDYGQLELIYQR